MKTKLTLTIDKEKIKKARRLARRQKTSISAMVEKFLDSISESKTEKSWAEKWKGAGNLDLVLKKAREDERLSEIAKKHLK